MTLRERYELLLSKTASPKSVDFGRPAIYRFDKFCKRCNTGMHKPRREDRRILKALFRKGFCSSICFEKGALNKTTPSPIGNQQTDHSVRTKNHIVEELAFVSLDIEKQESKLSPLVNMALFAERTFRLLSEKLRWMEVQTGQYFYPNKFYRLLERAEL